jgi:hypothetical protein
VPPVLNARLIFLIVCVQPSIIIVAWGSEND